jgi:aryl-alcohol dehydrogenase-like predicted oxidoreductase
MRYRQLGNSGLTVSVVGLGGNNFGPVCDAAQTQEIVNAALDAGITLFDCADNYGGAGVSEKLLGAALKDHRQDVVLSSKFGRPFPGLEKEVARGSRRYMMRALEGSLQRLGTDYLDLYYLHWPDPLTPIEETLRAMDDAVKQGKVRYIASSNTSAVQMLDWDWIARTQGTSRMIAAQNPGNLLDKPIPADMSAVAQKYGIGLIPSYPLAHGLLTGKYKRGEAPAAGTRFATRKLSVEDAAMDKVDKLAAFGQERGHSLLEVAISGLAAQPGVTSVIAGVTKPEQVKGNVEAGQWDLSAEDVKELAKLIPAA